MTPVTPVERQEKEGLPPAQCRRRLAARSSRGPRPFGCRITRLAEAGSPREERRRRADDFATAGARPREVPGRAGRSRTTGWRRTRSPAIPASSSATAAVPPTGAVSCTRKLAQKGVKSAIATMRLFRFVAPEFDRRSEASAGRPSARRAAPVERSRAAESFGRSWRRRRRRDPGSRDRPPARPGPEDDRGHDRHEQQRRPGRERARRRAQRRSAR